MRIAPILVILFITAFKLNAQDISEKELIGDWSVVKVHKMANEVPAEMKQYITEVQNAFLKSKYHFKADKNFSFDISIKEMRINNGHWKLNSKTGDISIQEWKDKDRQKPLLMGIEVLKRDGKTIFMVEETFFAFEVKRDN